MKIHCLNPSGINKHEKKANKVLEEALPDSWKGYSALEMVGKITDEFEGDLIIITFDRIIVVELKDYNGDLYSNNGKWIIQSGDYEGERKNGVRQARNAARILAERIRSKLYNTKRLSTIPWVDKCVVLCGCATKENLPEDEREIVFSLEEFKKIGNPKNYEKAFAKLRYPPQNEKDRPNKNIDIWDRFFINNSTDFKPKTFSINGYSVIGNSLFQHREKIYSEFKCERKDDKNYKALMRRWDFNSPSIRDNARTPEEKKLIARRESKVLGFIDTQDEDLKQIHLNLIHTQNDITSDFVELYEWPNNRLRLDDFVTQKNEKLTIQNRLDLIQVFISQLSRLHNIGVAHRDIGDHSVWVSLPTKITFSNFLAASYPNPQKESVRYIRDTLKHGRVEIPEDLYEDADGTPYTRDVYLAASVAHYIAYGFWPAKNSDGTYNWEPISKDPFNGILNDWFDKALDIEAKNRFRNLSVALDDLNRTLNGGKHSNENPIISLEKYHSNIIVFQEYSAKLIKTKGTTMLLRSDDNKTGIKLWNAVREVNTDSTINRSLHVFLDRVQTISNATLDFVPKIKDFGFNPSMQNLFVAYEWQDGTTWGEWLAIANKESIPPVIKKLLEATSMLHRNKIIHGDIHPQNIIIRKESIETPVFIDIFEYSTELLPPYNSSYVPDNFENLPIIARDRFSVTKIVLEAAEKCELIHLAEHCRNLIDQPEISENDINYTLDNFNEIISPPPINPIKTYDISSRFFKHEHAEIISDDGSYYISFKFEDKDEHNTLVKVYISGVMQQVDMHIDLDTKTPIRIYNKNIQHDQFIRNKKNSDLKVEGSISLNSSETNNAEDIIDLLLRSEVIQNKIKELKNITTKEKCSTFTLNHQSNKYIADPIRHIWTALVESEYELFPKIIVTRSPERLSNNSFFIHFSTEREQIDFNLNIENVTLKIEVNNEFRAIGKVIEISNDVLIYQPKGKILLNAGDTIRLEGSLSSSSLVKRQKAIESLINGRGLIKNLPDYFDPHEKIEPVKLAEEPTDKELDEYSEVNNSGDIIFQLNQYQREAFKQLYAFGPLGLLQGPPGTGKTAFIGSFIHYAIEHGATQILLVSQSHEAVNNAAEKVRSIFEKKNKGISIVRLGDEGNVSQKLSDVQEVSLQEYYRDKFRAEFKQRVKCAAESLGFSDDFLDKSIDFERTFGQKINAITTILYNQNLDADEQLTQRSTKIINDLKETLPRAFGITLPENIHISSSREFFLNELAQKHEIYSPSKIEKYKNIVDIATEWLNVMSSRKAQFQNFLTKTRTLVCGTCVGIGRNHYGIDENIYDLVIIDEAARATASELAIAMQVGRRIILVGDHKQLPPQLDEDHLEAAKTKLINTNKDSLSKSDFERAFLSYYGNKIGQTLSTQYRMALPIGELVSQCFYNGALYTGKTTLHLDLENLPSIFGKTVTWIDTAKEGFRAYDSRSEYKDSNKHSWENKFDVNVIISLIQKLSETSNIKDLFKPDLEPLIGVICMYSEQRKLLLKHIQSIRWARNLLEKRILKIDTVDSYQGKENSIIIVSLVRNNEQHDEGFLFFENRANVAISRAKDRLYIIGSTLMWKKHNTKSPFSRILSYIDKQNSNHYAIIDALCWERK